MQSAKKKKKTSKGNKREAEARRTKSCGAQATHNAMSWLARAPNAGKATPIADASTIHSFTCSLQRRRRKQAKATKECRKHDAPRAAERKPLTTQCHGSHARQTPAKQLRLPTHLQSCHSHAVCKGEEENKRRQQKSAESTTHQELRQLRCDYNGARCAHTGRSLQRQPKLSSRNHACFAFAVQTDYSRRTNLTCN